MSDITRATWERNGQGPAAFRSCCPRWGRADYRGGVRGEC